MKFEQDSQSTATNL